jgi:hypothetical protein
MPNVSPQGDGVLGDDQTCASPDGFVMLLSAVGGVKGANVLMSPMPNAPMLPGLYRHKELGQIIAVEMRYAGQEEWLAGRDIRCIS